MCPAQRSLGEWGLLVSGQAPVQGYPAHIIVLVDNHICWFLTLSFINLNLKIEFHWQQPLFSAFIELRIHTVLAECNLNHLWLWFNEFDSQSWKICVVASAWADNVQLLLFVRTFQIQIHLCLSLTHELICHFCYSREAYRNNLILSRILALTMHGTRGWLMNQQLGMKYLLNT